MTAWQTLFAPIRRVWRKKERSKIESKFVRAHCKYILLRLIQCIGILYPKSEKNIFAGPKTVSIPYSRGNRRKRWLDEIFIVILNNPVGEMNHEINDYIESATRLDWNLICQLVERCSVHRPVIWIKFNAMSASATIRTNIQSNDANAPNVAIVWLAARVGEKKTLDNWDFGPYIFLSTSKRIFMKFKLLFYLHTIDVDMKRTKNLFRRNLVKGFIDAIRCNLYYNLSK